MKKNIHSFPKHNGCNNGTWSSHFDKYRRGNDGIANL